MKSDRNATHRIARKTVETLDREILHRGGVREPVSMTVYVTSCACGRVFRSDRELLTQARYLDHLPKGGDR